MAENSGKYPKYIEIDGYRYPSSFIPQLVRSAIDYKPKDSDVFVTTYIKCGTTWMSQIVLLILRKGELPACSEEYFNSIVFLEKMGSDHLSKMCHPGCIKMHLPFHLAPYSPNAKYLYVARNPRDCCVSFYHHTKFFPHYQFSDGSFDDFFELFITGQTDFNDYFDNLLSWYEHRNEPNVFFTTFESMKADIQGTILKVAKFLGKEYHEEIQEDQNLFNRILHRSNLEYMKANINKWWKSMYLDAPTEGLAEHPAVQKNRELVLKAFSEGHSSVGDFIRQGMVGEGGIVLSEDQEQRLQERISEKTRNSDVMSLWSDI